MTCSRGFFCSDSPTLVDPGCGAHFRSLRGFDLHLQHRHASAETCRCRGEEELLALGFGRDDAGFWLEPAEVRSRLRSHKGGVRTAGRSMGRDSSQAPGDLTFSPGPTESTLGSLRGVL